MYLITCSTTGCEYSLYKLCVGQPTGTMAKYYSKSPVGFIGTACVCNTRCTFNDGTVRSDLTVAGTCTLEGSTKLVHETLLNVAASVVWPND